MINRKTNHRNEPCGKPGVVRRNLDIQYRQGGSQLKPGRGSQDDHTRSERTGRQVIIGRQLQQTTTVTRAAGMSKVAIVRLQTSMENGETRKDAATR